MPFLPPNQQRKSIGGAKHWRKQSIEGSLFQNRTFQNKRKWHHYIHTCIHNVHNSWAQRHGMCFLSTAHPTNSAKAVKEMQVTDTHQLYPLFTHHWTSEDVGPLMPALLSTSTHKIKTSKGGKSRRATDFPSNQTTTRLRTYHTRAWVFSDERVA